jgi:hypothetical protein
MSIAQFFSFLIIELLIYNCFYFCKILSFELKNNLFLQFLLLFWAGFRELRSVEIFFLISNRF